NARRSLDLREQKIDRILQPADFQPAAGDRAILDFAAIVIGHELAATDLAKHLALVRQARRVLLETTDKQVGRPTIDRHVIDIGLRARPLEDRLVIAGHKAGILAQPGYLKR